MPQCRQVSDTTTSGYSREEDHWHHEPYPEAGPRQEVMVNLQGETLLLTNEIP